LFYSAYKRRKHTQNITKTQNKKDRKKKRSQQDTNVEGILKNVKSSN